MRKYTPSSSFSSPLDTAPSAPAPPHPSTHPGTRTPPPEHTTPSSPHPHSSASLPLSPPAPPASPSPHNSATRSPSTRPPASPAATSHTSPSPPPSPVPPQLPPSATVRTPRSRDSGVGGTRPDERRSRGRNPGTRAGRLGGSPLGGRGSRTRGGWR